MILIKIMKYWDYFVIPLWPFMNIIVTDNMERDLAL